MDACVVNIVLDIETPEADVDRGPIELCESAPRMIASQNCAETMLGGASRT